MCQIKILRSNSLDKLENTTNKFLEENKEIIIDSIKTEFIQIEKPHLMYVLVLSYKVIK